METMKIGIITFTGNSNYGCYLQNYAVKKIIEDMGHSVKTIKTTYDFDKGRFGFQCHKVVLKYMIRYGQFIHDYRVYKFSKFSNRYLAKTKYIVKESAPEIPDSFDMFVLGSDQIWNLSYERVVKGLSFYTGSFSKVPAIAFSASVGINYIPKEQQNEFYRNLNRLNSISVREFSAKALIENDVKKNITVTVDPTLLLDADDWAKIEKKPKGVSDKKIMLVYFLGEIPDAVYEYILRTSAENDVKIVRLYNEFTPQSKIDSINNYLYTPDEFLWLFHHCEYIFTDSFHGAVFSIINRKPFRFYRRIDQSEGDMSSRTKTLFRIFDLEEWCYGSITESATDLYNCQYSDTDFVIVHERKKAICFLEEAFQNNEVRKK